MLPSFYFPGVYPKPINHFEVLTYSDLVLAHIILCHMATYFIMKCFNNKCHPNEVWGGISQYLHSHSCCY